MAQRRSSPSAGACGGPGNAHRAQPQQPTADPKPGPNPKPRLVSRALAEPSGVQPGVSSERRAEVSPAGSGERRWRRSAGSCCWEKATSPSLPPSVGMQGPASWPLAMRARRRCPHGAELRRTSSGCGRGVGGRRVVWWGPGVVLWLWPCEAEGLHAGHVWAQASGYKASAGLLSAPHCSRCLMRSLLSWRSCNHPRD